MGRKENWLIIIALFFILFSVFKKDGNRKFLYLKKYSQKTTTISDSFAAKKNVVPLIIPVPQNFKIQAEYFTINRHSKVFSYDNNVSDLCLETIRQTLNNLFANPQSFNHNNFYSLKNPHYKKLITYFNFYDSVFISGQKKNNTDQQFDIILETNEAILGESYEIKTNFFQRNIRVIGNKKSLFYGTMSLMQLLQNYFEPSVGEVVLNEIEINDKPRYNYRGMHLDVVRHFFSKNTVKKYIDFLAKYKFNKFHWHLTDDQGWRIEIKSLPKLTSVGSMRNETIIGKDRLELKYPTDKTPHGGFYTQEEIKEIVEYATARNIDIVPEIDLPGHALALLASYPEIACAPQDFKVLTRWRHTKDLVCASKPEVYALLHKILYEVSQLFPYNYIHLGGDETELKSWHNCINCSTKMKSMNIDEKKLLEYFFTGLAKFVPNKKIIIWDDATDTLSKNNFVVMNWKNEKIIPQLIKQQKQVILNNSRYYYFDHYQTYKHTNEPMAFSQTNTIKEVYLHSVNFKGLWGLQGALWTEYILDEKKIEYMLLPRLLALGEVAWSAPRNLHFKNFMQRLDYEKKSLTDKGVNFYNK